MILYVYMGCLYIEKAQVLTLYKGSVSSAESQQTGQLIRKPLFGLLRHFIMLNFGFC